MAVKVRVSRPPVSTGVAKKTKGKSTRDRAGGPSPLRHKSKVKIIAVKQDTPTIYIDDRAGSKELVKHAPLDQCGELCRLSSGDACFAGNGPDGEVVVGVEVKSLLDLLQSINTGRLQATQIPAMLSEYSHSWLLYYRDYTCGPNGELLVATGGDWQTYFWGSKPMPYGYLEGYLMTLAMAGIRVKRVKDEVEAAWWLGVLARWYSKKWDKHRGFHAFDESRQVSLPPGVRDEPELLLRARVAAQLPGVGYERAMAVARHFKSVREMVNAGAKEWEKVVGVGKTIGQAVERAVKNES